MNDARPEKGARTPVWEMAHRFQTGGLVVSVVALGILTYRDIQHRCEAPDRATVAIGDPRSRATKGVFESIYRNRSWGTNAQGVGHSGFGSTMAFTRLYRVFLQDFLAEHGIRSVVDAGCGDWEFSQAIDWSGIDYLGCDIVESIIAENRRRYGAPNIQFVACDIIEAELPPADLLIVKDVLQHLSNRDIGRFLRHLKKFKHVLIINDVEAGSFSASNHDIETGQYRPLDLTRPPFSLPMTKLFAWHFGGYTKLVLHLEQ